MVNFLSKYCDYVTHIHHKANYHVGFSDLKNIDGTQLSNGLEQLPYKHSLLK